MKIFRLSAALLVVALLPAPAFPQESSEITALLAKARRGNGIAQYNLGLAYTEGKGVAADPVEAYVWLSLARENGTRGRALDNVMGALDQASLEVAQRRLAERKIELGVRAPAPANVRPTTTAPVAKAPAPVETPAPVPPPVTDAPARSPAENEALAAEVTALRAEREHLITLAAQHEKTALAAEAKATEASRAADTAKGELARARLALTAAQKAVKPAAPVPPNLAGRVAELEAQLAASLAAPKPTPDTAALDQKTRELQAALTELEESRAFGRKVEEALDKVNDDRARVAAAATAELEAARAFGSQVENTLNKVTDEKTALTAALRAAESARDGYAREFAAAQAQLAAAKPAAPVAPAYPDLSGKVAELQAQLAKAREPVAPAYPDLRNRVAELDASLARLSSEAARAQQEMAALAKAKDDAKQEVAALTQSSEASLRNASRELDATKAALAKANDSLSAKPAAPSYPDLSGRVAELQAQLTQVKAAAPAYPDLSGKVATLEAQLAGLTAAASAKTDATAQVAALTKAKEDATQKAAAAEVARAEVAKQFDDYKSSTATAQRERTTLLSSVKLLESDKVSLRRQAENAGTEAAQLRTQVATLKEQLAAKPAAPSFPDLRERVAQLESDLVTARASAPAYPDLRSRVTELETQLAAKPAAPSYPNLSGRVAELESALAAKPAAPAYPDLRSRVTELEAQVASDLSAVALAKAEAASAKQEVAALTKAKPAAPSYPDLSGRVSELETQLTQAKAAAPAYPDLSAKVAELSTKLTRLTQENSQLTAASKAAPAYPDLRARVAGLEADLTTAKQLLAAKSAAPAYPDLSAKVAELETALRDSTRQLAAASTEADRANREIAALTSKAKTEVRPATPAYPDYSARVMELTGEVTQLRTDRERLQQSLDAKSAEAAAKADALAQATASAKRVTELEAQVGNLQIALTAPAAPAYPDLSAKVAELETRLAQVPAAPAAPAYPDLSGRVTELTGEVAQLRDDRERMQKMLADAGRKLRDSSADASRIKELETQAAGLQTSLTQTQEEARNQIENLKAALAAQPAAPRYPDLSGRVSELEATLAAKPAAPAYPNLSGRVAELEAQLASASRRPAAPSYPDLSGRVATLESELSAAQTRLAQPAAAPAADTSDLEKRLAETEDRLATALRGYALLEKDRDALQAKSGQATETLATEKNTLAAQVATLTAQVEQLQGTVAAQAGAERAANSLSTENNTLAGRLAETEGRAAAAQAEVTRLGESLAALQRSTGQTVGDAASSRALVQQLQGANSVLAQENYQLKTALARTTGRPAPATPTAVLVSPPAARTHVVTPGDTLSRISQRYYGTPGRWQEIYNANTAKLGPNGVLRVGTELRIP